MWSDQGSPDSVRPEPASWAQLVLLHSVTCLFLWLQAGVCQCLSPWHLVVLLSSLKSCLHTHLPYPPLTYPPPPPHIHTPERSLQFHFCGLPSPSPGDNWWLESSHISEELFLHLDCVWAESDLAAVFPQWSQLCTVPVAETVWTITSTCTAWRYERKIWTSMPPVYTLFGTLIPGMLYDAKIKNHA